MSNLGFSQKQLKIMFRPQVWHKVTVDLEEDARRVLGLPSNMRAVKDEFPGDVGEGPSSSSLGSCIATCMQEPVREVGGRRESGEEGDVVNLVEAIREASVEESRRGKESKVAEAMSCCSERFSRRWRRKDQDGEWTKGRP